VREKYGYVSFVIPKSKLDDFRDEIEAITHKKLYTENTSSQNLLNQKQNIEERTDLTNKSLSDLQSEKSKADAEYKKEIASLQAQLKEITLTAQTTKGQLDAKQSAVDGTPEYSEKKMLAYNYDALSGQIASLKNYIAEKNTKYTQNKNRLDSAIGQFNNQLGEIKKDDKAFAENIETVNGSVSIQWVSLWQLAKVFSPIHPIIIILLLVIIVWYILKRLRIAPLVVVKW
jgi:chromosome segregation ATPase